MYSPVTAGGSRNTSVVVVTLDTSEVYIIVSLSFRTDTQVIYIDPTTGILRHDGKLGCDVFNSQDEALNYITDDSRTICKSTTYAKAILGYAVLGGIGLLLVATKLTASIPYLPGGGCVYTVSESKWIKITLLNPQPQGKGEVKNVQELTEFEIDGKHYFCETRDITRPFPSRVSLLNPDDEFVWNGWFSVAFRRSGLAQHCVILLQGFVENRTFGTAGHQEGIVALIARRSRLHPGTRYLARGLNSCYSTGNEIECEQLVWVPKRSGQNVPFNTYVWRRGTIPIWWGAELKMTAAEAAIYVSDRDPYRGSARYYQRLTNRYDTRNLGANQNKNGLVPIICVNLLRSGEGKSEAVLVQHFEESLNYIRSTGKLPNTRIHLIHYDWHTSNRLKGEEQTIQGLWYHLKAPTISIGISEGDYLLSRPDVENCEGEKIYNDDVSGVFCLKIHQNGVIRYNCADSLDRTNAASFFGALQVFTEQCRRLGIYLDNDLTIDHKSRTTSTKDKPWKRFDMTFEEFKKSTLLSPICQLADLFLIAGDIHATIYTGSKAMHSHILNIFSEEAAKSKNFSVAQNVKITLQRRYNNAVTDSSRQKQLEMFLGLRLFKHLPSVSSQPLHVLSRRSAFLLKPIASVDPSSGDGDCLLSFKQKDIIWVSQQAADIIQLFIYLGEPCHVCQLLFTVSHGADDSTYPSTVDVRTGRDLDVLKLVVEGVSIPRCPNGTNMVIPIPGPISDDDMTLKGAGASVPAAQTNLPFLYDFKGQESELDFLTRVVVLTFYPAESTISPVTLGEVEILGIALPWRDVFASEGPGLRLLERVEDEANSYASKTDSDTNVIASKNDVLTPEKSNTSPSSQIDLLSGDNVISGSDSQPIAESTDVIASKNDVLTPEKSNTSPSSQIDLLSGDNVISGSDSQPIAESTDVIASKNDVLTPEKSNTSPSSQIDLLSGDNIISGSDSQPIAESTDVIASKNDVLTPEKSNTSPSSQIDLLSGDNVFSGSDSQPIAESTDVIASKNDVLTPRKSNTSPSSQTDLLSSDNVISGSDSQPIAESTDVIASKNDVLTPGKSNTSPSSQIDLLSGDNVISGSDSQPIPEISLQDLGYSSFHDHNAENDSQENSTQDIIQIRKGAQHYINCFETLTALHGGNKLGFVEAMKLEIERLRLNLSATERDKALSSIGIDPATIDPNTLVEESCIGSLCKASNALAILGQVSLEDKTTGAIGLDSLDDDVDIDFWNINRIGEGCCGEPCKVHAETLSLSLTSSLESIFVCSACQRKVCRVCCAGKGAILLRNGNSGSSSNGMDGVICKLCCRDDILDALTLDYIRVLISQRKSTRAEKATLKALDQVVGDNFVSGKKEVNDKYGDVKALQQLLNGEESLAEFPFGSFLHSIESASGSAPPLSLLAPLSTGLRQSYWRAPAGTTSAELIIVLGNLSDVSGVVLLVSPCGYSMSDSPTVQIWASNKLHKEERSCVGKWEVRSLITSSPELCGPEESGKDGQTPRHVRFDFKNPVRCRMIWITLSIQKVVSSSVSFGKNVSLLSLDEDTLSGMGRRASIAGTSEGSPCIHAKRFIVTGCVVKEDTGKLSSRSSEHASSIRNWLEKAPLLNRYKVPVESEKLIDNDLVLEQIISPASPVMAGFRLDGFSAIKSQLTHSPYSSANSMDTSSSIVYQHRFLSPAVLHVQVLASQGSSSDEMSVVGEYRVPEVKSGTPMYFDFPKIISSQRVWFRLVGDVTRFADDPEEGEGGRALAAGLSLLNRIKLYYYAYPSELGRWSGLSGI